MKRRIRQRRADRARLDPIDRHTEAMIALARASRQIREAAAAA